VGARHKNEIVFSFFAGLELHVLEVFDDLVDISVVSLTGEFENFVNVRFLLVEATQIRILLPDIDLNLKIFL
jgi:hypothetical protein